MQDTGLVSPMTMNSDQTRPRFSPLLAIAIPLFDGGRLTPPLPMGISGVGNAVSLIYISFFGYQLIANSAQD